jgi:hypothetical protein
MASLPVFKILSIDHAPAAVRLQDAQFLSALDSGNPAMAICFGRRAKTARGAKLSGHVGRLVPVIVVFLMFACGASAESAAETAGRWGLLGRWSLDCSLPPDRDRGAVLAYEITEGGKLIHRRDFGSTMDIADVIGADVSAEGVLNLRIFFPQMNLIREFGLKMQADGSIRAMYNRDQKGQYSIKDGKFTANGKPTPPQYKCKPGIKVRLHPLPARSPLMREASRSNPNPRPARRWG